MRRESGCDTTTRGCRLSHLLHFLRDRPMLASAVATYLCAPNVLERAQALERDLARALQSFESRVTVSTMTITARLNVDRICRDSMEIALALVEGEEAAAVQGHDPLKKKKRRPSATATPYSTPTRAGHRSLPDPVFYNQVTMRHGTKSIKVFNNGSMHVTGCKTPVDFLRVTTAVCRLMNDTAGIEPTPGHSHVFVTDFQVQMINLNFSAETRLYLQSLQKVCIGAGHAASYDADVYPGLNIKFDIEDHRVTVLAFTSGKIIITGARTVPHIQQAYGLMQTMLSTHARQSADADRIPMSKLSL